jgi:predicted secreted Zn-dependent protease
MLRQKDAKPPPYERSEWHHIAKMTTRIQRYTGMSIPGVLAACSVAIAGPAGAQDQPQKVRYEVSGSSPIAEYLSFESDTGQHQQANVRLPWSTEFKPFGGEVFVISAQGSGTLTCRILVNGNVVNQATANGLPARTVCTH